LSAERTIQVRYFASMREQCGRADEALVTSAATPAALYADLAERHGFKLAPSLVRFALNGEFTAPDAPLSDGDEVCLIPPVAGG
jgi:molybdopterin converting factor subunit 1